MNDFKLWSNGTIKMPYMNIPVLDIRKCLPDMWKAVACSLQIKPCHIQSRGSAICKYGCSCFQRSNNMFIALPSCLTDTFPCDTLRGGLSGSHPDLCPSVPPQVGLCGHPDPVWRPETFPRGTNAGEDL